MNTHIKLKSLIISAALLLMSIAECMANGATGQDTPRDSIFLCALQASGEGGKAPGYDYYISKALVSSPKVNGVRLRGGYWLVFVDKMPAANWEHPCEYIYVKRSTADGSYAARRFDGTLPPDGMDMEPMVLSEWSQSVLDARKSTSEGRKATHILPSDDGGSKAKNDYARHTYAVILSGGSDPKQNASRYWNDCSFIYRTLTGRFGVPKANVKVLMAAGLSDVEDTNYGLSMAPDLAASPKDLDGDGSADIDHSATKDTLKMVLADLRKRLTDTDHLLVFVTDHGGYDDKVDKAFICLWNQERIYAEEFASLFDGFNTGYISFVLGQCYSGDFVPALEAPSHIVMTACGKGESSYRCKAADCDYNEFLYNWTSAMNGQDPYGNAISLSASGKAVPATMKRAFEYAVEKDSYNKGKTKTLVENPQLSILENSTAEDLALDTIPEAIDLYIRSYDGDLGKRPYDGGNPFWSSPDIWGRVNNDGFVNHQHQNVAFTDSHLVHHLYVKVRNRGTRPYIYEKGSPTIQNVNFAWAKSSLAITKSKWTGRLKDNPGPKGGYLGYSHIKERIEPGDSAIVHCVWSLENGQEDDLLDTTPFNACLLAYITDSSNTFPSYSLDSTEIVKIWETDKVAQKNSTIIEPSKDGTAKVVYIGELAKELGGLSIVRPNFNTTRTGLHAQEVSVMLSPSLFKKLKLKDFYGTTTKYNQNPSLALRLDTPEDRIGNINLSKGNNDYISLDVSLIADEALKDTLRQSIDLALVDDDGNCLGGENFVVVNSPRPKIDVKAAVEENLTCYTLSVTDPSEEVSYEWYDNDGEYVSSNSSINVQAGLTDKTYTVKVKSKEDNAIIYKTLTVPKNGMISSIDNLAPGHVAVGFASPAKNNTVLRIIPTNSASPLVNVNVEEGATSCHIEMPCEGKIVYQVQLLENGQVVDMHKITNQ